MCTRGPSTPPGFRCLALTGGRSLKLGKHLIPGLELRNLGCDPDEPFEIRASLDEERNPRRWSAQSRLGHPDQDYPGGFKPTLREPFVPTDCEPFIPTLCEAHFFALLEPLLNQRNLFEHGNLPTQNPHDQF